MVEQSCKVLIPHLDSNRPSCNWTVRVCLLCRSKQSPKLPSSSHVSLEGIRCKLSGPSSGLICMQKWYVQSIWTDFFGAAVIYRIVSALCVIQKGICSILCFKNKCEMCQAVGWRVFLPQVFQLINSSILFLFWYSGLDSIIFHSWPDICNFQSFFFPPSKLLCYEEDQKEPNSWSPLVCLETEY